MSGGITGFYGTDFSGLRAVRFHARPARSSYVPARVRTDGGWLDYLLYVGRRTGNRCWGLLINPQGMGHELGNVITVRTALTDLTRGYFISLLAKICW